MNIFPFRVSIPASSQLFQNRLHTLVCPEFSCARFAIADTVCGLSDQLARRNGQRGKGGRRCDVLGGKASEGDPQLVGRGSVFYDIEGEFEGQICGACGWVGRGKR